MDLNFCSIYRVRIVYIVPCQTTQVTVELSSECLRTACHVEVTCVRSYNTVKSKFVYNILSSKKSKKDKRNYRTVSPMNLKMVSRSVVFIILLVSACLSSIRCHPQCTDSYPPFEDVNLQYCSHYREFGCCVAERDAELQDLASSVLSHFPEKVRGDCDNFVRDILCQECSPYAAHVFNMEGKSRADWSDFPGLCTDYCHNFHETCRQLLPYLTRNHVLLNATAGSSAAFCEAQMIDDVDYCFPDVLYDLDLNDQVQESQIGSGDDCLCLEEFANNLRNPLALTFANDRTHRIYVVEQTGVVTIFFRNGSYLNDPFLDIEDLVYVSSRTGDERGLLGLAFHPNYAENHKFYVHYTTRYEGTLHVRISELKSFPNDTNRADARTERPLIQIEQPAGNHNGGSLFFDVDGYLLISLGDGGSAGDPYGEYGNGLNLTTFLGKILRIDVDGRDGYLPYGIPPSNPFVREDPEMNFHEIFAYGVRNMWRCSVDRGDSETGYGAGRIFCGDVGQNKFEEIDIVVNGGNYGWRAMEGNSCYDRDLCNEEFIGDNYVEPIHVYSHAVGKSVTGGYVYRGCQNPHLQGLYIYGDFWNGRLFKLEENEAEWTNTEICLGTKDICTGSLWNFFPENILSFGEDEAGEVYMLVTDIASSSHTGGKIFKFVDPNKRGNPEECHVEERPVPVFGPTSPFEPSNNEFAVCPENCPALYTTIKKKKFCKAYYAFVGTVSSKINYNSGMNVQITGINVLRKKSYIRDLKETDTIILQRKASICSCPDLQIGETYFFMGSYRFSRGGQFIIKTTSIVRKHHWYMASRLNGWLESETCK